MIYTIKKPIEEVPETGQFYDDFYGERTLFVKTNEKWSPAKPLGNKSVTWYICRPMFSEHTGTHDICTGQEVDYIPGSEVTNGK